MLVIIQSEKESEQPVGFDVEVDDDPDGEVHCQPAQQQLEEGGEDAEVYQEDVARLPHHCHTEGSDTGPGNLTLVWMRILYPLFSCLFSQGTKRQVEVSLCGGRGEVALQDPLAVRLGPAQAPRDP